MAGLRAVLRHGRGRSARPTGCASRARAGRRPSDARHRLQALRRALPRDAGPAEPPPGPGALRAVPRGLQRLRVAGALPGRRHGSEAPRHAGRHGPSAPSRSPELARHDLGQRVRPGEPPPRSPEPRRPMPASRTTATPRQPGRSWTCRDISDLPDVPDLLLESEVQADAPAAEAIPADAPPPRPRPPRSCRSSPSRPSRAPRPSRAWAFGVAFLALVLAAPAHLRLPRPPRAAVSRRCGRCWSRPAPPWAARVPWVNDEAALKLEDSELLEVPGKPGQIALQARIRNLSPSAQEFPAPRAHAHRPHRADGGAPRAAPLGLPRPRARSPARSWPRDRRRS